MTAPATATHLQRNLRALDETCPTLAARLRTAAGGEHVRASEEGVLYRHHATWHPLHQTPEAFRAAHRDLEGGTAAAAVLVLGIGLGESVAALVERDHAGPVVAWDRDPWLLRLALALHDYTGPLRAGSLRFALGADLLDALEVLDAPSARIVRHPLLARVYHAESRLAAERADRRVPSERPRAALCTGALFVDDLATALADAGYDVVPIEPQRWSVEELDHALGRLDPELVCAVNYVHGLARFCSERGRTLVCWEVDPTTDRLLPVAEETDTTHLFTWRAAHVPLYRAMGFAHVEHLPLASDVEKRRPLELSAADRERFGAPVAFVGSSLVERAVRARALFLELFCAWHEAGPAARAEGEARLQEVLDLQRADYTVHLLPALLEERFAPMLEAVRGSDFREDPVALAAEIAAAEKRLSWLSALGEHGLSIWGDAEWAALEPYGVRWRGEAGHHDELTRIYAAAPIHVDVGRLYQQDIVPMRVFDVLACGGFLIAEHSAELARLFEVGVELESYRTPEELAGKVAHYAAHPADARAIAARGLAAVRERHTIRQRLATMLAAVERPATVPAGA